MSDEEILGCISQPSLIAFMLAWHCWIRFSSSRVSRLRLAASHVERTSILLLQMQINSESLTVFLLLSFSLSFPHHIVDVVSLAYLRPASNRPWEECSMCAQACKPAYVRVHAQLQTQTCKTVWGLTLQAQEENDSLGSWSLSSRAHRHVSSDENHFHFCHRKKD